MVSATEILTKGVNFSGMIKMHGSAERVKLSEVGVPKLSPEKEVPVEAEPILIEKTLETHAEPEVFIATIIIQNEIQKENLGISAKKQHSRQLNINPVSTVRSLTDYREQSLGDESF